MAEKNLIKIYVDASSAKRVDIIIKHYTDFIGIVDGYTEGLRYMIESEKDSNSHRALGDLGVRVQTGGSTSDPTAKKAIRNVMTREALINCDFSGDVAAVKKNVVDWLFDHINNMDQALASYIQAK